MTSRLGTILLFLIVVGLFLLSAPLWASGNCKGRSCNQGSDIDIDVRGGSGGQGGSATIGDVSGGQSYSESLSVADAVATSGGSDSSATIQGSRSYGYGMGDVDINDCYRSWSVPLVQGSQVNPLCLAQQLMIEGNYEAAAVLRCRPAGIYKAFGGREECQKALSRPPLAPTVPEITRTDDEDYHESHEAELQALREAVAQAQEKARKATVEARYAVQEAKKPSVVRYGLTEEQRQELAEVFAK